MAAAQGWGVTVMAGVVWLPKIIEYIKVGKLLTPCMLRLCSTTMDIEVRIMKSR